MTVPRPRGRPRLAPELRKPHRSGPSGRARQIEGAELAEQRAAILSLVPPADVLLGVDGPELRPGALQRLGEALGMQPSRLYRAWSGEAVRVETIERWRASLEKMRNS